MKDTKNMFGIYLPLLDSNKHARCSLVGVRVLTLVSHGKDPNKALNVIIYDISRGVLDNFTTVVA